MWPGEGELRPACACCPVTQAQHAQRGSVSDAHGCSTSCRALQAQSPQSATHIMLYTYILLTNKAQCVLVRAPALGTYHQLERHGCFRSTSFPDRGLSQHATAHMFPHHSPQQIQASLPTTLVPALIMAELCCQPTVPGMPDSGVHGMHVPLATSAVPA